MSLLSQWFNDHSKYEVSRSYSTGYPNQLFNANVKLSFSLLSFWNGYFSSFFFFKFPLLKMGFRIWNELQIDRICGGKSIESHFEIQCAVQFFCSFSVLFFFVSEGWNFLWRVALRKCGGIHLWHWHWFHSERIESTANETVLFGW